MPSGARAVMLRAKEARVGVVALMGSRANRTSIQLVDAWCELGLDARLVSGRETVRLGGDDLVLGRLDVLPTVDGVEPGLFDLLLLERRGVPVRNPAAALLAAHDKLRTARLLARAGIPGPRTGWVRAPDDPLPLPAPLVLKPRFGSWGTDVHRCSTEAEARELLHALAERSWFRRHGALVQELVRSEALDLRVLVAGGRVMGAVTRTAAPGEWRTNVSLGGHKAHAEARARARELALAAAAALGCDLVAVDLLRVNGGFVVLELNAAADFDQDYVSPGEDVYEDVARALELSLPSLTAAGRAARAL
jgi:ribosomal protein S6--L-glutamate ligase